MPLLIVKLFGNKQFVNAVFLHVFQRGNRFAR